MKEHTKQDVLKVLFYLKRYETSSEGLCPVMGRIRIGGTTVNFSTKLLALVSLWESKSGRLSGRSAHATGVNAKLNDINVAISRSYKQLIYHRGAATAQQVKDSFQGMACSQETLLSFYAQVNEEFKKRADVDRTQATANNYEGMLKKLTLFIREKYKVSDIPFTALTYSFIDDFEYWMRVTHGHKPNFIVINMIRLMFVIRSAFSKGYLTKNPFAGYKPIRHPNLPRPLTADELEKIMTTPLHDADQYLARDMFLFSCYTNLQQ